MDGYVFCDLLKYGCAACSIRRAGSRHRHLLSSFINHIRISMYTRCRCTNHCCGLPQSELTSNDDTKIQKMVTNFGRRFRLTTTSAHWLDYGSVTLAGVPGYLLDRLQSVLHAAARLVTRARKYDPVSSLLQDLHWLRDPERIKYRLAVLVYRCRNHTAPEYLARDLHWVADDDSRRRLQSSTTQQLKVP